MRDLGQTGSTAALNALLGAGSVFEGKLHFEGQVRIDGTFTGEITTTDLLIIGEGAKVSANINCGSVEIKGDINGNVNATDSIVLRATARVQADIYAPSLVVDKGAVFEGNSRMTGGAQPMVTIASTDRRDRKKGKSFAYGRELVPSGRSTLEASANGHSEETGSEHPAE
jgi:cytoskeletal protein CcmA (bactofilin family)